MSRAVAVRSAHLLSILYATLEAVGSDRKFYSMLATITLTAGLGYLVIVALLFFGQSKLLYLPGIPGRSLAATPASLGLSYKDVHLRTADDVQLHAWWIPAPHPRGVLLFCHGNAGNISHRLESIKIFYELDLSVLIFDYRGYGRSEGKPSESGTYQDAEAAWRFLVERQGIAPERIILFGRSLGGSIAAWLGSRHPTGALIIESSFVSIPEIAAHHYSVFPVRWLARLSYETGEYLQAAKSPVLVIHSRSDEIIPFAHGQALYDAAPSPKRLLEIEGGHNEGFLRSLDTYRQGINDFLEQNLDA